MKPAVDTGTRAPSDPATAVASDVGQSLSNGERAALEGLISSRKPAHAVATGAAERVALETVSLHSARVHSFDAEPPARGASVLPNVTFNVGDRRELLLEHLDELARAGRNVDFALICASPDSEAVREDIETLLESPATSNTLVVICNAMAEPVRAGLIESEPEAWPKVTHVDLNFVPGRMLREEPHAGELQGGLGLVVTQADRGVLGTSAGANRYFDAFDVFIRARPTLLRVLDNQRRFEELTAEIGEDDDDEFIDPAAERRRLIEQYRELDAKHARLSYTLERTTSSVSWRVTKPLRDAKGRVARFLS
jgi:hypothetical protein